MNTFRAFKVMIYIYKNTYHNIQCFKIYIIYIYIKCKQIQNTCPHRVVGVHTMNLRAVNLLRASILTKMIELLGKA